MTSQRIDFADRAREVARYLRWLRANESHLSTPLLATMRAAAFLLIYNMVESSARALTETILDVVGPAALPLSDLSPHLRREFLRQALRKGAQYDLIGDLDDPAHDVTRHYDPEKIFSGNVDAKAIRERLVQLGCPDVDFRVQHGINTGLLKNLRNTRNDLAHGTKSFAGVGGSAPQSLIEDTFVAALRTLRLAFNEVEGLLARNDHLK